METLWGTLITGAVALVAGYLGALWGSRNEHSQWLRNEKQKAYSTFPEDTGIADYENVLNGILVTSGTVAKQRAAIHRLQLFAPERIVELASKAVESAKTLSRALRDNEPTDGMADAYASNMLILSYAMRLDLQSRDRAIGKSTSSF